MYIPHFHILCRGCLIFNVQKAGLATYGFGACSTTSLVRLAAENVPAQEHGTYPPPAQPMAPMNPRHSSAPGGSRDGK